MWLRRLDVDGIRNLSRLRIELEPGVCGFFGPNGAGKSSLLEAVYCLSTGRSFRSPTGSDYIAMGHEQAVIYGEVMEGDRCHRLGLSRGRREWTGRLDGSDVQTLEQLARALAVQVFHPKLHQLIEGAPEERRRFLDFGVFHVEPEYLRSWRGYRRVLRQRNAALRQGASPPQVAAWDPALVASAEAVNSLREAVVAELTPRFQKALGRLAPELGTVHLSLRPGWREGQELARTLAEHAERDRRRGFTGDGPHRADLHLSGGEGNLAGVLSRGQQKAVVLALTLAMQALVGERSGRPPVLCVDDFSSELDEAHRAAVLAAVAECGAQALITGTEAVSEALDRVFHVEQGEVREVV